MQINVAVTDANNIVCEVVPPQTQIITIDRGVAGNGIVSIVPVTISTFQYLRITYTNGTVQDVGPLTSTAYTATAPITIVGNTISLATVPIASGGTDATTAAGAIQNLLPSYTGNGGKRLGLNSGATALEWVLDGGGTVTSIAASGGTTGLTFSGSPITTSGTLTLGGTLAIASGGTGATSAASALTNLGAIGAITSTDGSVTITSTGTSRDLSVAVAAATTNVIAQVRNTTGATLTKGTAVYISGATGQISTVSKALANSDASSAQTLGLITADLANNTNGNVTVIGLVTNLNTSAYSDGQQLYLSPTTAGALTATKPYAPNHLVYVAVVEYAHPTQGKLFVKVQNGYELDELHDVSAQTPSNGQTLVYNSSNSLWENNTVSLAIGVNGTLPIANGGTGQTTANAALNALLPTQTGNASKYLQTDGTNSSWDAISLSTADITGTLGIANGGTGQITANAAFNALAPTQTGQSGKYLTTDGSNTSWATNPLGTVTSVAATVPSFLSISGSPITTSGTLAFGLSGTALPTTSGGTGLTSFTANGVVYASSTSALATSSALTFDGSNINLNGTYNINQTNLFEINNGQSGATKFAAGVSLTSNSGGIYNSAFYVVAGSNTRYNLMTGSPTTVSFYSANSEKMLLDGTGLGIGTSSPAAKLDVTGTFNGTQAVFGYTSGRGLLIGTALNGGVNEGSSVLNARGAGNGQFLFQTDGTLRMTLNDSGNLGLGVTPSAWAVYKAYQVGWGALASYAGADTAVFSNAYFDGGTWRYVGNGTASQYRQLSGAHSWQTAASGLAGNAISFTQSMTLDASGNLIVGQTSATGTNKLSITTSGLYAATFRSSGTAGVQADWAVNGSSIGTIGSGVLVTSTATATDFGIGTSGTTANLVFATGAGYAERMRIDSSGNVGIGTSSPSAKLHVENGNVLVRNNTGAISFTAQSNQNTAYTAALTCNWDENILLLSAAGNKVLEVGGYTSANVLRLFTGNSERARIDSAGNFGIGTTSPASLLDVATTGVAVATIRSTSTNGAREAKLRLNVASTGGDDPAGQIEFTYGTGYTVAGSIQMSHTNPNMKFYIGTTERARIDGSGNLLVGTTTSSSYKLDVQSAGNTLARIGGSGTGQAGFYIASGGAFSPFINFYSSASTLEANIYAVAGSAALAFTTGASSTERMRINSVGDLLVGTTSSVGGNGITAGTTSSGKNITLVSSSYANNGVVNLHGTDGNLKLQLGATSSTTAYVFANTGCNLDFYSNGSVSARLDSSGNLLVGTTATSSNIRLRVSGGGIDVAQPTSTSSGSNTIADNGSSPQTIRFYNNTDSNNTTNRFLICDAGASVLRAEIRSNGGIANYSANNVNLSDRREKTNFAPATSYLDKICAIPVQTFNYIDQNLEEDDGLTLGVVAQDVQAIAPELVTETNWGTAKEPKMRLSIYQTDLQYALMKALQELKAEFDAYKASHP